MSDMDTPTDISPQPVLPPEPSRIPAVEPTWWRLGWVPYLVLLLVAAAADFLFPRIQGFGAGAAVGVILAMGALLLLRRDFSRGECLFLIMLAGVCSLGLLLNGSFLCWILSIATPFALVLTPGKSIGSPQDKYLNWWQFWLSHRIRTEVGTRAERIKQLLPLLLSIGIGIICFVFFLCIFASGNPVVELVWQAIANAWNRLVSFLDLNWEFCFHAFCWALGALWFGLYTYRRPAPAPQAPLPPVDNARSLLPYLAPSILVGTNLAFIIATTTDVAFLWFQRIPQGISRTDYLYDGAASITWASAIAAVLLGVLFRRRGSSRRSSLCRIAGYALLIQTFVLAASVYLRLYYQVEAYGFTARRIMAAESMLMGLAGLVFLLIYMSKQSTLLSLARPFGGVMLILITAAACISPQRIAGDLNLRYAATHTHWQFSASDFNRGAFCVQDNIAFAWYVYRQSPNEELKQQLSLACTRICRRNKNASWRSYNILRSADVDLAPSILDQL